MTLSITKNKITHVADGNTKTFSFDFRIDDTADVEIYYDGVLQTPTPLFTIDALDLGVESGGDIVFDTAPPAGNVTIYRNIDITQEVDYTAYGAFKAETHEKALDRLVMICQQQQEQIDRAWLTSVPSEPGDPLHLPYGLLINAGEKLVFNYPAESTYIYSPEQDRMEGYVGGDRLFYLTRTVTLFDKDVYTDGSVVITTNNKPLWGYTAGGSLKSLIKMNTNDEVEIGQSDIPVNVPGGLDIEYVRTDRYRVPSEFDFSIDVLQGSTAEYNIIPLGMGSWSDTFAYPQNIQDQEYWDGSSWQSWSTSNGFENLFDQNPTSYLQLESATASSYRCSFQTTSSYHSGSLIQIFQQWTNGGPRPYDIKIEVDSDTSFASPTTLLDTSVAQGTYFHNEFIHDHYGDRWYRLTITVTDYGTATYARFSHIKAYTTYLYQGTYFGRPYTADWQKNITFEGDIDIDGNNLINGNIDILKVNANDNIELGDANTPVEVPGGIALGNVNEPLSFTNDVSTYYLWVDGTGDLRIKDGIPQFDTDGTVVGTQS